METSRLKAFLACADSGSFTEAAARLNYSPSGVSQLVSAMEKDFGMKLLIRTTKGVSLTRAGEEILPVARALLQQQERLFQTVADLKGLTSGTITIATYSSIAINWLPEVISRFQQDYPKVRIHLMEGTRQGIVSWLETAQADLGFLSWKKNMPFDWIPLAGSPIVALVSPTHPLAKAQSYPIRNCENEPFIMPAGGKDDDLTALFSEYDIQPDVRFTTVGNYAAIAMIEKSLGISFMNAMIAKSWKSSVVSLPLDPPQSLSLGIAVPSLDHLSPAARRFIQYSVRFSVRIQ